MTPPTDYKPLEGRRDKVSSTLLIAISSMPSQSQAHGSSSVFDE